MRKRAAFRNIVAGTLLGITLFVGGIAGTAVAASDAGGGGLSSTGPHDVLIIGGFAVVLSAIGAGLSTLARRPVR